MKPEPLLAIRNVSVDYITANGSIRAVNQVSADIHAGETLGLAGESGCGKSTLAFAITRLLKVPALIMDGSVMFDGKDILNMDEEQLRAIRWSEISIVFQSAMNALNPVITVGEQMTDVIRTHRNVSRDEATDRAVILLEQVGIHANRLKSFPHQLSGGMRQRIVIAIALALEPRLIIMDEPTTALDVVVEREIMDELDELKKRHGFSILFISHDLSLMAEITDRIGVMYGGKLVEMGATTEVMHNPFHPYTKGLLDSFPTIGSARKRLTGIPGSPVNLLDAPTGCYFRERCSNATAQCQQEPEVTVLSDRQYACHHPLQVIEQ